MPAREGTNMAIQRPTETWTAVAGAIVTIAVYVFNITDSNVIGALPVIVGALPAGITWLVDTLDKRKAPVQPPSVTPLDDALKRLDGAVKRLEAIEPRLTPELQTDVHGLEDELRLIENNLAATKQ